MDVAFYKRGAVNYMLFHYERKGNLVDKVDSSKTRLNKVYGDNVDIRHAIDVLIKEAEKTNGRSLKKDTTLLADWIIQVPHEIEHDPALMDRFFKLATEFTKKEYGYITKGWSHLDECRVVKVKDQVGNVFNRKINTRPHIHISFIPYGRYIDKRYNKEKIGFNYGFRFNGKKALLSYQYRIEEYLTNEFKKLGIPSLDFGKGNSMVDDNGKKRNVKELHKDNNLKEFEKDEIINQYEQIINTQKRLFLTKYKDNPQVKSDYLKTFNESVELVEKRSLRQRLFTRVRRFIENVFYKKKDTSRPGR